MSSAVFTLLQTLGPILIMMVLGYFLFRIKLLSEHTVEQLNRFIFWVALPALLIEKTAASTLDPRQALDALWIFLGATIIGAVLGLVFAVFGGVKKKAWGTFLQASYRANLAFTGLPVIIYYAKATGASVDDYVAYAMIIISPVIIFYNFISVALLILSQEKQSRFPAGKIIKSIALNPLVISCVIGLALNLTGTHLPLVLSKTLSPLGETSMSLSLIVVGASLGYLPVRSRLNQALLVSITKLILLPLVGWYLVRRAELPIMPSKIVLFLLAQPTAVVSYALVGEIGGDKALASAAVVLTSVLSLISLAVIVLI